MPPERAMGRTWTLLIILGSAALGGGAAWFSRADPPFVDRPALQARASP